MKMKTRTRSESEDATRSAQPAPLKAGRGTQIWSTRILRFFVYSWFGSSYNFPVPHLQCVEFLSKLGAIQDDQWIGSNALSFSWCKSSWLPTYFWRTDEWSSILKVLESRVWVGIYFVHILWLWEVVAGGRKNDKRLSLPEADVPGDLKQDAMDSMENTGLKQQVLDLAAQVEKVVFSFHLYR